MKIIEPEPCNVTVRYAAVRNWPNWTATCDCGMEMEDYCLSSKSEAVAWTERHEADCESNLS